MKNRPPDPSTDPAAWEASSFAGPSDYAIDLSERDREEILAALSRSGGRPIPELGRDDFRFAELGLKLHRAYDEVRAGRGFVLLRGLPTDGLSVEQFSASVWGIGLHFGVPLSQNAQGELVSYVVDATAEDETPRMYRSNMELRLHTDITAMISLACWQTAAAGGASVICSAVRVHDEIKRRAPAALALLYRGFHYHRLGEEGPNEEPVTPYRIPVFTLRNGQVSCRYMRSNIVAGHRAIGMPLGAEEIVALDLFDEVARDPQNRLAFFLERGEMMVINNYAVMHARTAFTDHPEPERRRLLVRLWLDAEGLRAVPRAFNHFATNGVPKQEGRRATFDFKKLYSDDPVATGGMANLEIAAAKTR